MQSFPGLITDAGTGRPEWGPWLLLTIEGGMVGCTSALISFIISQAAREIEYYIPVEMTMRAPRLLTACTTVTDSSLKKFLAVFTVCTFVTAENYES